MHLSAFVCIRRILNSPYHAFRTMQKPDIWQKREQLRRFIAWQYASKRTTVKKGGSALNKIFHYTSMQREDAPKLEKFYAEQRLVAALAEHHFEYAPFRNMLAKAHIQLDNIVLSQLAIYEPQSFKNLVMLTKQMALEDGREVIVDNEQQYVQTDPVLFGEPFPRSRVHPKGAAKNHQTKPRPLKYTEY